LLIAISGYLISIFVVTRINRISDTAFDIISTGDLSKRVEIDSRWDDLSFLASVLNKMLDKIETLMQGVQHITDTVAHDLRTPLARLRNKLETAELKNQTERNTKSELINEVDALLKTFNALLSLSSIESGRQGLKFESFDFEKVLHDAVDFYLPLADEKNQQILVDTLSYSQLGNRDLIFQVVANLLDNAIKFTPENGNIEVKMWTKENTLALSISDNGPGISIESRKKVFARFYRDQDHQHHEGVGLGLSLVQAVLKLHNCKIKLQDNQPGLKVTIFL